MTIQQFAETLETLNTELDRLEHQCAAQKVDVRPWASNDHPLSLEHWGLTQRKLRLLCPGRHGGRPKTAKPLRATRILTSEHLAAMQAGRKARQDAVSPL
jgi:hypothetical protein